MSESWSHIVRGDNFREFVRGKSYDELVTAVAEAFIEESISPRNVNNDGLIVKSYRLFKELGGQTEKDFSAFWDDVNEKWDAFTAYPKPDIAP